VGEERPVYVWVRNSIEFKVGKIIGYYYRYGSIEEVSERIHVAIV
jgi:hypothetical protein